MNVRRYRACILLALAAQALAACSALRTDYSLPDLLVPAAWRTVEVAPEAEPLASVAAAAPFRVESDRWWGAFSEADLSRFMATVIESNNDLASAAIAARRAALQARLTGAQLGPQVNAGLDASTSSGSRGTTSYSGSASVSYELDLWGRVDATRDAAAWEAQASEEDRQAVALALTGNAATLWFQIGILNIRIASAEESLAYAERTRALVQSQYRAGAVSSLELAEAEQSVQAQRAALTQLTQTRVETRNAIALLRDGRPLPVAEEPLAVPAYLPPVEPGIPAELLSRRPDLRAAERRLRATLASGDATRLSYYPAIGLTGSAGSSSRELGNMLADPVGTLAASLSFPFLQANEMRLATDISEADFEQAVLDFRQTLRSALVDVENALSARTQFAIQGQQLEATLEAARTAERLYEARYRAGGASLREWLDAQDRRRQAELNVDENRFNQLSNQVTLYLALGGGDAGSEETAGL